MASYVQSVLLPDEKIRYQTCLHWVIYLNGLAVTIAGGLLSVYGVKLLGHYLSGDILKWLGRPMAWLSLGVVVIGCLMLFFEWIIQTSTELVITDRRVIAKVGVVSRSTQELFLSKIESANIEQSFFGRLLGYGCVLIHGTGGGISPIDLVAYPTEFQSYLLRQVDRRSQGEKRMGQND